MILVKPKPKAFDIHFINMYGCVLDLGANKSVSVNVIVK